MQVDLDALDRLHAAATKGDWTVEIEEYGKSGNVSIPEINRLIHDTDWADPEDFEQDQANAEAIATLHNYYPALAAELREARREVTELRASNAKLAWAWNTVQDENASRAADGAKVLQAAVVCMNSLAWLDARDRRMKALGAVEALRTLAKEQDEHAAPHRALITSDQLNERAAELEAVAGQGEEANGTR